MKRTAQVNQRISAPRPSIASTNKIKADPKTRLCHRKQLRLHVSKRWFHAVDRMPGACGLQAGVYVIDVFYAFVFQPLAEGVGALFCVYGDTFFPGGASAEHAVEFHTRFRRQFERLRKL